MTCRKSPFNGFPFPLDSRSPPLGRNITSHLPAQVAMSAKRPARRDALTSPGAFLISGRSIVSTAGTARLSARWERWSAAGRYKRGQFTVTAFIAAGGGFCFWGKLRMISSTTRDQLTDIVIDVVLPCSIIASFQMEMTAGILRASFQALLAALGIQVLYWVLNLFLYKRYPPDEQTSCKYATMVTNASFIGIPVVTALYGAGGTLLASIFVLPQRIFMWAYGLPMYTKVEKKRSRKENPHPSLYSQHLHRTGSDGPV